MSITAPVPLYYSIIEYLMKQIEDNALQPGSNIMSERELMEMFGMSRTTVRKALDVMVNEGYLFRIQGKGTFVAEKKKESGLGKISSCSDEIRSMGMTPSFKVISATVVNPRVSVANRLGITEYDKIFRLERILYADDTPVNITISHLRYEHIAGIEKIDFSKNSLYDVLEKEYGFTINRAVRSIEATTCGDKDSKYLDVKSDLPALLFKGVMYGRYPSHNEEIALEYFFSKYRCDKYRFYVEQFR